MRLRISGLAAAVESMNLVPRRLGHDELCNMVRRGELHDPKRISEVVEKYRKGVIEWAVGENIDLAPSFRRLDLIGQATESGTI
jgi:hypothetical protein